MNISLTRKSAARVFFLLILAFAPLYMTKGFRRILTDKAVIVWVSIAIGVLLFFALFIKEVIEGAKGSSLSAALKEKFNDADDAFNILDYLVAAFGAVCVISSALSEYKYEAFSGAGAWYVGGAMLTALCIMYFITAKERNDDIIPFFGMMLGGAFTMLMALLNDLWIDPLNALATVDVNWRNHYTSTIGNANQFCGYLSVVIPIMVIIFISSENGFKRTVAAIVLFLGYLNMFLTHADSIFLGVGIGYLFIFAYSLKKSSRYMGLLINGILFGIAGFAAKVIILYRPEIKLDDVSPILLAYNAHMIVGGICFALLLLQMFLELRFKKEKLDILLGYVFWIYLIIVAIMLIIVIGYSIKHYDMYFLNRRGFLWYAAASTFWDGEFMQQLIGIGPGCIDEISRDFYFEIEELYGQFYFLENAHNDVMEYLLTTGALGALSYLGIYLYVIVSYIKSLIKNEDISGIKLYAAIGLIGYIAQSIMNGPHPLTTAMFFVLLAIYRSTLRPDTKG